MDHKTLNEFALGNSHLPISEFFFYNGNRILGRVIRWLGENGPIRGDHYFILSPDIYIPGQTKDMSLDWLRSNGVEIASPEAIEKVAIDSELRASKNFHIPIGAKFRKLIILGAGASVDAFSNDSSDFPLSNDLFKRDIISTMKNFPGVMSLENSLAICDNLEVYFRDQYNQLLKSYNPSKLSDIINVQYYLHNLFLVLSARAKRQVRSNHRTLVNAIYDWLAARESSGQVMGIINYNYDLLMDDALESTFDISYKSVEDYIDLGEQRILLFKPHGSSNWIRRCRVGEYEKLGWRAKKNGAPQSIFEFTSNIHSMKTNLASIYNVLNHEVEIARTEYRNLTELDIGSQVRPENSVMTKSPYFPHLLLPQRDKDDFIMPREHVVMLRQMLQEVEDILVIGWKGEEASIQKLFSECVQREVQVTVVGRRIVDNQALQFNPENGPMDFNTKRNLANVLPSAKWTFMPIGFSGYCKEIANGTADFFNN